MSTIVTSVPSAANIEAYSTPITPAPITRSDFGSFFSVRIPSESITVSPSTATGGAAGRVPTAMTILAASTSAVPDAPVTVSACGPVNAAAPPRSVIPLRFIWARMTSISRVMTWLQRRRRSPIVMSSFTE